MIPWQTIGRAESWVKGDELALLYPPNPHIPGAQAEPVPSLRLKALRRGQQDVEYLIAWAALTGQPRWAVAAEVRRALALGADRQVRGEGDAGSVSYRDIQPGDLAALRHRVGQALAAGPHPLPATPGWTPTPRDPAPTQPVGGAALNAR